MKKWWTLLLLVALLASCSRQQPRYVVGVSQCSADIWRDKQNAELRMGTYFRDDVELRFAAAYDSDERQVQQIDSLIREGIDLLIVAPNQVLTISPAIDRAYDSGIPVIVFERKTSSKKYTAFISADNYEMGHVMGKYIADQLQGRGRVLEVMGLEGSSPAIERHKGFADAIRQYPDIEIVATLQGDWTEQSAYEATRQWLDSHPSPLTSNNIDFVFGQNDRMAMGVRRALIPPSAPEGEAPPTAPEGASVVLLSEPGAIVPPSGGEGGASPKFCGIDGLPGEGGGIQLVRDSLLDATYIYPTHGDQLLDLAVSILDGKPYDKEVKLKSALVTRDNANVLLMQAEETQRQTVWLDQLHQKADTYLQQLDSQRAITLLAFGVVVLLVIAIVFFYLYHIGKVTLRRERVVNTLWEMGSEEAPLSSPKGDTIVPSSDRKTIEAPSGAVGGASLFIARFREVVETRLDDSDLSVEDLAADMNLSRVQLYRKVKSVTGSTPVELLRTARLKRAYQMLMTTDKSISEVAYAVGFTAPSYFTKCFKEEFGQLPGDLRG